MEPLMQPTRTNLLLLRERLQAVGNCTLILKGRRQALIKEFLKITKPLLQSREDLRRTYQRAMGQLQVSMAHDGPSRITSLAAISRRDLAIEVREQNLLGLHYRDVELHETIRRSFGERDYNDRASTPWLEEAITTFEEVVEEIVALAAYEGKFRRLAEELVRLTRRIRVLEERVTPALTGQIHQLSQYLAERERESFYRLKRFKNVTERRQTLTPQTGSAPVRHETGQIDLKRV